MYYRKADKKRRRRLLALRLIIPGLALILAIFLIDRRIRPVIQSNAMIQAKVIATTALNDAVAERLKELGTAYESLTTLQKDEDGKVISLQTDTAAVNQIQSALTGCIMDKLAELEKSSFTMHLGTLLNAEYLSGHGPAFSFQFQPNGYVTTKMVSRFTDAGINQTHHEMIFEVSVTITAAIPGYATSGLVSTGFILADTVIVGDIPEYYTNVVTEEKNLVEDLNDYTPGYDTSQS